MNVITNKIFFLISNMVKYKNILAVDTRPKKKLSKETPLCSKYPDGTTEGVFCQVQNFPRIVVLNEAFGVKKVLELNQCNYVGQTNQPCGFPCCDQPPFPVELKTTASGGFNPNPPYIPPPSEQIQCYNLRSALNQCDINKRNFDYRIWPYQNVVYP
jgi:hypothetical protein